MLKLLTLFLILAWSSSVATTPRCPTGAVPSQEGNTTTCHLFVAEPRTYPEAETYCQHQHGRLIKVQGFFTGLFLADKSRTHFPEAAGFWVGAWVVDYSNTSLSLWTKFNGFVIYTKWKSSIDLVPGPSHGACASISVAGDSSMACDQSLPFICEVPGVVDLDRCAKGYSYFPVTGMCYKVFQEQGSLFNFDQAEARCVETGGHLVSIHSKAENTFVSSLAPGAAVDSSFYTWIGARSDSEKTYTWTDGTAFDYQNFNIYGQHLNSCTVLLTEGNENGTFPTEWEYFDCAFEYGRYICKNGPASTPFYLV